MAATAQVQQLVLPARTLRARSPLLGIAFRLAASSVASPWPHARNGERGLLLSCSLCMSEPLGCSRAERKWAWLGLAGNGEAGLWPPGTGPHARAATVHDV